MIRSGLGFDLHPLVPGRPLILGGVSVPSDQGLGGHSDDAVLSTRGGSLLGAMPWGARQLFPHRSALSWLSSLG